MWSLLARPEVKHQAGTFIYKPIVNENVEMWSQKAVDNICQSWHYAAFTVQQMFIKSVLKNFESIRDSYIVYQLKTNHRLRPCFIKYLSTLPRARNFSFLLLVKWITVRTSMVEKSIVISISLIVINFEKHKQLRLLKNPMSKLLTFS